MCCNEAADGEDGLDCKEGEFRKIKILWREDERERED
jgi:hypothetical protein